jgi:hypothetical protein
MGEIPSDLLKFVKDTLKKCDDIFLEHRDLWHIFSDARLQIWQDHLPEAFNLGQRIERTIYYLKEKENTLGENALVLLLYVLSERYLPHDERHDLLLDIVHQMQTSAFPDQPRELYTILAEANPSMVSMLYI